MKFPFCGIKPRKRLWEKKNNSVEERKGKERGKKERKGEKRKEKEEMRKTMHGGKGKKKTKGLQFPVFQSSKFVSLRIKVGLLEESYE